MLSRLSRVLGWHAVGSVWTIHTLHLLPMRSTHAHSFQMRSKFWNVLDRFARFVVNWCVWAVGWLVLLRDRALLLAFSREHLTNNWESFFHVS